MGKAAWRMVLWVVVSALLQVACFPIASQLPYWRSILAWFALSPFLFVLLGRGKQREAPGTRQQVLLGYLCGVIFYLGNCSWIYQTMYLYGGLPKVVSFVILLLFSAYLGLYHAFFAWIVALLSRTRLGVTGALLLTPFAWVAVELARSRITGFPWDLLGYSQIDNRLLLTLAPVAGVLAISFVLVAVNACIVYGLSYVRMQKGKLVLVGASVLVTGVMLAGFERGAPASGDATGILLQENLSVGATARGTQPISAAQELKVFSELTQAAGVTRDARKRPVVAVWPEAPSHLFSNDRSLQAHLGGLATLLDAPVIVGSIGLDQNSEAARGYSAFDSAALFDRTGTYRGRYDKIHLVPWGEYVPYKRFFAFAQKLTEGVGDMDPGTVRSVFRTDSHAYGIFICYESIFGDEVRQFVRNGADVLVNISDDGWYGDTGAPWQHLNMARMRAVENRRWVLRATNTGETTTIDPEGRYTETVRHVRTAYVLPFSFRSELTMYTRYGDWFGYLAAFVTALAVGYGLLRHALRWKHAKRS